ncbi:MAG: hypothetical protein Q4G26_15590, partial [Paracoccus sp. (in: a-proteobacteria)]|nr:hypothetical protein [Paracoccus sp. (in: a-proteobacteria)]
LALAATEGPFEAETGTSQTIRFPETGESVTFLAGRPLADALFKGPRQTRKRQMVAAAALILLREGGVTLPDHIAPPASGARGAAAAATPRLLDLAQAGLRQAATALAAGQVNEAGNRLFSIAISARVEAIPRLAGLLRGLSQRLDAARLSRAEDRPEAVFAALATAYALAAALRRTPDDPVLTGVQARSFTRQGARELIWLGAEHWANDGGARGFTGYLIDPASGRFHRAVDARAGGVDLRYDGLAQWSMPLWRAGTPAQMAGRMLHFEDLAAAADGAISLSQNARIGAPVPLLNHEAVQRDWGALWDYRQEAGGRGLRRQQGEVLALIAPAHAEAPAFDPLAQQDIWLWQDHADEGLALALPDQWGLQPDPPALGLAAFGRGALPRLIAYWPEGGDTPVSLLDPALRWRKHPDKAATPSKVPQPPPPPAAPPRPDVLERWFDRLLETTLTRLGQPGTPWPAALITDAETLGLGIIANALHRSAPGPLTPDAALRLAYMADQARQLCR